MNLAFKQTKSGWAVVDDTGSVHGEGPTKEEARRDAEWKSAYQMRELTPLLQQVEAYAETLRRDLQRAVSCNRAAQSGISKHKLWDRLKGVAP